MRTRWFSSRSVALHVALALWLPACAFAAWWQVTIALAGDQLGYLYAVEWPCFAIFGAVAWWHLVRDDPATVGARALQAQREAAAESAAAAALAAPSAAAVPLGGAAPAPEDPELARYNEYLAELAARERDSGWRRS